MSLIDVVVLVITILIILTIIFFAFVKPKIDGVPRQCASCPARKKGKRLIKEYRKQNKNEHCD